MTRKIANLYEFPSMALRGSPPRETLDEQEVAGYAELMELVFASWQDIPLATMPELQLQIVEFARASMVTPSPLARRSS